MDRTHDLRGDSLLRTVFEEKMENGGKKSKGRPRQMMLDGWRIVVES